MSLVSDNVRAMLEAGDVDGLMQYHAKVLPHLPQLNRVDSEAGMHMSRTELDCITFKKRAYSHAWLIERGLPSRLPDSLLSSAERLYPRVVEGVGISVNAKGEWLKPAALAIRKAMENAVADIYANGDGSNVELINLRMYEARKREERKLFGR